MQSRDSWDPAVQKKPVGSSEAAETSEMCDPLPSLAGFSVNSYRVLGDFYKGIHDLPV
jgi:hypothetical protein